MAVLGAARAVESSTCSSTGHAPEAELAVACSALTREAFGRLGFPRRAQEKLQGVALRVDRPIQIHPGFADFDVRFVDSPGSVAGFEVRPAPFVELWGIALDPAVARGVVHLQSPFSHQFLQVAIAERVAQIPPDTEENDL